MLPLAGGHEPFLPIVLIKYPQIEATDDIRSLKKISSAETFIGYILTLRYFR